jgi:hypothetical protein
MKTNNETKINPSTKITKEVKNKDKMAMSVMDSAKKIKL